MPSPTEPPERPENSDALEDSGRHDPVESLYRGPAGAYRSRPTHFEQSVTRPEGQHNPDDQYGWLYRSDGSDPQGPPVREPAQAITPPTSPSPPQQPQSQPEPVVPVPEPRNSRWTLIAVILGVVLVTLIAVGAIAWFRHERATQADPKTSAGMPTVASPAPTPSVSSAPSITPSTQPTKTPAKASKDPYQGEVKQVAGVRSEADCIAPPAKDSSGREVRYDPSLTLDDDPNTAWRCDGSGKDRVLTLHFDKQSIAEVGLINGYTKVDPANGAVRYSEYRRITKVVWSFPGGAKFTQKLVDSDKGIQKLRIPVTVADRVKLTIKSTTKPGKKEATRDAVLISEISLAGPEE